jgi:recombinational DNA repair protein (RecF pathway)
VDMHVGLWQSPEKLFVCQYVLKVLDNFVPQGGVEKRLFALSEKYLHTLSKNFTLPKLFLESGILSLCSVLGYGLNFSECSVCGKRVEQCILEQKNKRCLVDFELGGFVCGSCSGTQKVNVKVCTAELSDMFVLSMLLREDWSNFKDLPFSVVNYERMAHITHGSLEHFIEKSMPRWQKSIEVLSL